MVTYEEIKFPPLSLDDSITLDVPAVDRVPLDFANIIGAITKIKNGVYRIGTKDGLLKGYCPRTEIAQSGTQLILLDKVPKDVMFLTLREAAAK